VQNHGGGHLLVGLGEFQVEFDAELLADVEDVGGHDANVDALDVLGLWQRVDVLDHIVDVLHQTHFDECFVLQIKGVALLKRAHNQLAEEPHDAHAHVKVHVFDAHLRIQREHGRHAPLEQHAQVEVVLLRPRVVVFDPPRVLEKGDARPNKDNEVVLVLLRGHHALVQQHGDFGQHVNVNGPGVLLQHVVNARIIGGKTLHRQHFLHAPARVGVSEPCLGLHARDKVAHLVCIMCKKVREPLEVGVSCEFVASARGPNALALIAGNADCVIIIIIIIVVVARFVMVVLRLAAVMYVVHDAEHVLCLFFRLDGRRLLAHHSQNGGGDDILTRDSKRRGAQQKSTSSCFIYRMFLSLYTLYALRWWRTIGIGRFWIGPPGGQTSIAESRYSPAVECSL